MAGNSCNLSDGWEVNFLHFSCACACAGEGFLCFLVEY